MSSDPYGTSSNSFRKFFSETIPNAFKKAGDWVNKNIIQPVETFINKTLPEWWNGITLDVSMWLDNNMVTPYYNFWTQSVPDFFTDTVPDFFVDTVWNDWIVDKSWNQFIVGTIWDKGLVPAWNWVSGDKWYQILLKNVIFSGVSTIVGTIIGGPWGAFAGFVVGVIIGCLNDISNAG